MANVVIDIAAEFTGKKAFKQADTAADKLSKSVRNVAKSLGLTFGAAAMLSYGKNSVKAFAENEKSAKRLETVLKNIGLAFDTNLIEKNLESISAKFGYEGEVLRDAFQGLVTVTGSTTKAQDLLNLSLDIAAGSGEDLLTVNKDLAAVYVGNTKGLRKYNLGLAQSELKTLGFEEAVAKLTSTFAGAATAELETYSGKMRVLKEAADNAQEIIGKGLVDALSKLGSDDSVNNLADSMENVATYTADVIRGIGILTSQLKALPGAGALDVGMIPILGTYLEVLQGLGKADLLKPKPFSTPMTISGSTDKQVKIDKARAKAEADAAKRAKELLALQKKASIAEKNKLSLTKASAIFDLNKIQIAAALKNTYDIQERTRLEAMMAIENEDGVLAIKKINELAALQADADMRKLMGIKAISEETLSALNEQLLAELRTINESSLAESEKERLRDIAFGKYNAALTQAGDLMEKSYYSERVQIQLTEISKLAAASNSTNAMITLERLRMGVSLDVIATIREKQAQADKERYAALLEYIRLLETLGGVGVGLKGASDDSIATLIAASKAEADSILIESNAIDAMTRADKLLSDLYSMGGGIPSTRKLGANVNATDFFNSLTNMAQTSFGGYSPSMNTGAAGSVPSQVNYVTVNTAAVGSEDFLARTIQQVIQDINRSGSSTYWAGSLNS